MGRVSPIPGLLLVGSGRIGMVFKKELWRKFVRKDETGYWQTCMGFGMRGFSDEAQSTQDGYAYDAQVQREVDRVSRRRAVPGYGGMLQEMWITVGPENACLGTAHNIVNSD
ncbi:hypothetical protein F441_11137 [Phytophthora nicotianae CJ01A1]|uniref:Uncharacterized protein n=1 Tax=Phytophthora nicotianae CJ01A1 TaxID=1317063 RepID=W2WW91_PHYNI|nr:hypothetical protein F441_11137 [Phytophthora nicotianae CJ01A1]